LKKRVVVVVSCNDERERGEQQHCCCSGDRIVIGGIDFVGKIGRKRNNWRLCETKETKKRIIHSTTNTNTTDLD
jgi:hypothetical protein